MRTLAMLRVYDLVRTTAAMVPAILAAWVVMRGLPLLRTRMSLIRERDEARCAAAGLTDAVKALQAGNDGWKSAFERLSERVRELGDEIKDLKHKNALQTQFICNLIAYVKSSDKHAAMPIIPDELRDHIHDGMADTIMGDLT